jgi:crotonobetainyl-CoA:carnitine CoA-transferase CaiB-like acyl-CoA transferase
LQAAVRACSEAFFAKKVIVCEGKTEIGICRALDKYRKTKGLPLMSFADCAYVLGEGSSLVSHTREINEAEFKTALFCDSDNNSTNDEKLSLRTANIEVFDCEDSKNIEGQVFNDLPWDGVRQLIDYVLTTLKKGNLNDLKTAVKSKYQDDKEFSDNALEEDSSEIRIALAAASTTKDRAWFKRLDHGEAMGQIIFEYLDVMDDENHLKKMLLQLSKWIDS